MNELRERARALLQDGSVQVVIGYGQGSDPQRARALFARTPEQTEQLIYDANCQQNLAVYLLKSEVKALGKAAIVAPPAVLRSVLQLAAKSQLTDGQVVVLGISAEGKLLELDGFAAIEQYLATLPVGLSAQEKTAIDQLQALEREQRWEFWLDHFSRCLKCYACRAACTLCYCNRCVVDCNQPQWVSVAPHPLGNMEWHLVRAMHLAGRCINCGDCARACPVAIPLNLLTQMLAEEVADSFGVHPGTHAQKQYALAMFKPEDKEDFIG